ncbi:hypothetical protein F444_02949 [Phytophthora nicotianae P1976]|uniref:Uncharacterized protein n=1 Tax=Phytophthora nicotianae P1976 TaxID=1317066 RepID=A0A081AVQ3_PHYNI|nr:hypothetical protein F444_02949 [Phytophthora nicotianae P1976]
MSILEHCLNLVQVCVAAATDYQPALRALAVSEPAAPKEAADVNIDDKKKKEWWGGGFGWGGPWGGWGGCGGWGGWGGCGGWGGWGGWGW